MMAISKLAARMHPLEMAELVRRRLSLLSVDATIRPWLLSLPVWERLKASIGPLTPVTLPSSSSKNQVFNKLRLYHSQRLNQLLKLPVHLLPNPKMVGLRVSLAAILPSA